MKYKFTIITEPNDRGNPEEPDSLEVARDHMETVLRAFNIKVERIHAEIYNEPLVCAGRCQLCGKVVAKGEDKVVRELRWPRPRTSLQCW